MKNTLETGGKDYLFSTRFECSFTLSISAAFFIASWNMDLFFSTWPRCISLWDCVSASNCLVNLEKHTRNECKTSIFYARFECSLFTCSEFQLVPLSQSHPLSRIVSEELHDFYQTHLKIPVELWIQKKRKRARSKAENFKAEQRWNR